jgi:GH24 family phage-related lysozyme (muramidase)
MSINTVEELIALDEGKRLQPYQDSEGIWTVGIGHNLEANGLPPGVCTTDGMDYPECLAFLQKRGGLTEDECDELFDYDLHMADCDLSQICPIAHRLGMDSPRYAALMDMCFNLGAERFRKFTGFLGLICQQDFAGAADDLRNHTAVYKQLPHRYERLAKIIETGEWP